MGEVFAGRYELLDPIATGGMGTVWCVLDRSDHQVKAAKILRQSDASSLLRFVREQSMRIDHLHVVTPQSWAGMDDRVLFTMPLVRGGSVAGLVKQYGALPLRWVAILLDQTLHALEAVHAAGIVHRDVKPGNLLLEPTGTGRPHLRLTDFGIAAPLDEPRMTRASMVIGSPGYMAPEQWRGADPDFRSDLYSVGRVGAELLTGQRPSSETVGVDASTLRTGDPRRDALVDLLARAAAEHADQRPPSATAMRRDLSALGLADLPPEPGETIRVSDEFTSIGEPTALMSAPAATVGPATMVDRQGTTRAGTVPATAPRERVTAPPSHGRGRALSLMLIGVVALAVGIWLMLS